MAIRIDEYGHIIRDDSEQHSGSMNENTQNEGTGSSGDRLFIMPNSTQMETPSPTALERPRQRNRLAGLLVAAGIIVLLVIMVKSCSSERTPIESSNSYNSNYASSDSSVGMQNTVPSTPDLLTPIESSNSYNSNYTSSDSSVGMQNTVPSTPDLLKLTVNPYMPMNTSIEPYDKEECSISDATFDYYSGVISQAQQEDVYSFTTIEAGTYRIELADMVSGFKVSVYVYDSSGSRIDYSTGIGSGSGVTVSLNANSTYKLMVKSSSGTGAYNVFIGRQKSTVNVGKYTTIYDSIEFQGQQNNYLFTPSVSGIYRFYIAQINSGIKVSMYVYDDAGYRVDYSTGVGQNSGVNVTLEAGKTYSLQIRQYNSVGDYTLAVGYQKNTTDITGYTAIDDCIEFLGQQNNYLFTPSVSGIYRFYITQINSGIKVSMYVYDDAGYRVDYSTGVGQNSGVNVTLEAGKTYSLQIRQYDSAGNYTLAVGYQKDTVEISNYDIVSDSIQFIGQENNYTYVPTSSGEYTFKLSDIASDCKISIYLYDSAGYRINYNTGMTNGSLLKTNLDANATYSVVIKHYFNNGDYTINISR